MKVQKRFHEDDVSFNSIMNDIFMMPQIKENGHEKIKVVVCALQSKNAFPKIKNLQITFENKKLFQKYDKDFLFESDFSRGDQITDYYHYIYLYNGGSFKVYYKIIK